VYDVFVRQVHDLINKCIPIKEVNMRKRDPPFVTPLVKVMLKKRLKLRQKGRIEEADSLAVKINQMIQNVQSKRLSGLSNASSRELWSAVKNSVNTTVNYPANVLRNIESVNSYFANVCNDPLYDSNDVSCFARNIKSDCDVTHLEIYEVEKLLKKMKRSSPGDDNIPRWFFHQCSFEIAETVCHIFNLSFSTGTVPQQWRRAIVTPIPKVPKPVYISSFRPISVTPLLSRLAEKLFVRRWLIPAITHDLMDDQFGFRPTGSTTCALTNLIHHVTTMLEECKYVRCLMIDFSRAFDTVDHPILLAKLSRLNLPDYALNWIISFLSGRTQVVKINGVVSSPLSINTSIIQGSGVGPSFYIVMESDLRTLSRRNVLCKYADDTNLLVSSSSDIDLVDEFDNIKEWALENKMIINLQKTVEIVFHRPNPKLFVYPAPIEGIEQVFEARLLGMFVHETLSFSNHASYVLKLCSQRMYLLKLLRDQGLSRSNLNIIFHGLVLSRIQYAVSVWGGFLNTDVIGQLNSMLRRGYKYGFCEKLHVFEEIMSQADRNLFRIMQCPSHCLNNILPKLKEYSMNLRSKGHSFELPQYQYELFRKSFVPRSLFAYK
jgi:hypothetical protein